MAHSTIVASLDAKIETLEARIRALQEEVEEAKCQRSTYVKAIAIAPLEHGSSTCCVAAELFRLAGRLPSENHVTVCYINGGPWRAYNDYPWTYDYEVVFSYAWVTSAITTTVRFSFSDDQYVYLEMSSVPKSTINLDHPAALPAKLLYELCDGNAKNFRTLAATTACFPCDGDPQLDGSGAPHDFFPREMNGVNGVILKNVPRKTPPIDTRSITERMADDVSYSL